MPMTDLLYARAQMGLSLAFHIIFAAAGVALPVLMVLSDWKGRRTGDADYQKLSQKLAKGTAILFAVGAVSGTVLSFELGLLWPEFMGQYGEVIGLPFSLEGVAFFTEAIFLGIYLYGRERVSPGMHLFSGVMVAVSGAASAFFVTLVNTFMNHPSGFTPSASGPMDVQPLVAMFSPGWQYQTAHVLLSCYQASAFAMAGIHAFVLLRYPGAAFHRKALSVALPLACVTALLQPVVGDLSAKHVAKAQPVKLAAMEGQFETERGAPLRLGGLPNVETGEVPYAVDIPKGLSILAFADPDAEVKGLNAFPRDEWPPVAKVHVAFQVMVGTGSAMALLALVTLGWRWRKKAWPHGRKLMWAWLLSGPLGVVAMEAGWLVTEWGRQPWILRGVMRTADAVTPVPHLAAPFWTFTAVYLFLGVTVVLLLVRQVAGTLPTRDSGLPGGEAHVH
ncbi:cytochrome BD ubiquinol oxidase subunit I [Myxococcus xanthus]|uniref:Cytochrome BD ubiquinol oxidase subunit I n=1 Tax=Myxococcus xanthus TaxID=34 RepID=A0AAE6G676_MYXXA|nr:cytochrome ubiquinol oxidase subunit I [Myxococcus xanthus]QDE71719.1 cytochrome BD ubiquinol oxidase subunit I [Myxococcus xanthus]QDE79000.1 cytochrome BD ubiquinol oxidase subunit I [Myxococcus xanthus]QDF08343.1 cytochrome BD ubiquinol oxidase subunit I [Myxococcus xanthus]